MNDLELVRYLRSEVPVPATATLASGRSRLLAAASREQARFTGRPAGDNHRAISRRVVKLSATAAAVAVIAGLAGYGIAVGVRGPAAPAASNTARAAVPEQAALAARILRAASSAVDKASATSEPSPHQWIYAQTEGYDYNTGNLVPGCKWVHGPTPGQTDECQQWIRFDGNAIASWQGGRLVVSTNSPDVIKQLKKINKKGAPWTPFTSPEAAYEAMASLPKNPRALLAAVDKVDKAAASNNIEFTGGSLAGDYLMRLLWIAAGGVGGPPKAEAAVFQALADLPGITVQQGITDIAGAQAIGVRSGYKQLLLDPVSYQVIGLREFNPGPGPNAGWPKHGGLVVSMAYTQVHEVSGPGIR
jgi:hypothetical protein